MGFWDKLLSNEVLISAVVGWTVAQVLKTLIDFGPVSYTHLWTGPDWWEVTEKPIRVFLICPI